MAWLSNITSKFVNRVQRLDTSWKTWLWEQTVFTVSSETARNIWKLTGGDLISVNSFEELLLVVRRNGQGIVTNKQIIELALQVCKDKSYNIDEIYDELKEMWLSSERIYSVYNNLSKKINALDYSNMLWIIQNWGKNDFTDEKIVKIICFSFKREELGNCITDIIADLKNAGLNSDRIISMQTLLIQTIFGMEEIKNETPLFN